MEKVISFVMENYQFCILIGSLFLDVLLCILIKRKKEDPILRVLSDMLPCFISDAEVVYGSGHGDEKRFFVLDCVQKYYKKLTGVDIKLTGYLYRYFVDRIENILKTPQKKKGDK